VLLVLDNACAFTERGGITVRATDLGDCAQVEVEDTGPGIPAEQRERAFERYTRNVHRDELQVRRDRGLGLGLYICRELITRMGGEIWIEEAPGGGTSAVLTLPYAPAPR
jgi:signal transduction histidine kinase